MIGESDYMQYSLGPAVIAHLFYDLATHVTLTMLLAAT
jgi:hypothetical protein